MRKQVERIGLEICDLVLAERAAAIAWIFILVIDHIERDQLFFLFIWDVKLHLIGCLVIGAKAIGEIALQLISIKSV